MIKITVSSVEFNYENEEVSNITINYRGQTDDYQHNLNGSLDITEEEFDAIESNPADLVEIVKDFLVENIKNTED